MTTSDTNCGKRDYIMFTGRETERLNGSKWQYAHLQCEHCKNSVTKEGSTTITWLHYEMEYKPSGTVCTSGVHIIVHHRNTATQ